MLRVLKREGSARRKAGLLLLRINFFPRRNLPKRAKKPDTERTRAQGHQEYANPSATDRKPPSRLQPALSHPEEERRTPRV